MASDSIFKCYIKHHKDMAFAWLPETRYSFGEIVSYNGKMYFCVAKRSKNNKPIDLMNWRLIK